MYGYPYLWVVNWPPKWRRSKHCLANKSGRHVFLIRLDWWRHELKIGLNQTSSDWKETKKTIFQVFQFAGWRLQTATSATTTAATTITTTIAAAAATEHRKNVECGLAHSRLNCCCCNDDFLAILSRAIISVCLSGKVFAQQQQHCWLV